MTVLSPRTRSSAPSSWRSALTLVCDVICAPRHAHSARICRSRVQLSPPRPPPVVRGVVLPLLPPPPVEVPPPPVPPVVPPPAPVVPPPCVPPWPPPPAGGPCVGPVATGPPPDAPPKGSEMARPHSRWPTERRAIRLRLAMSRASER